MSYEVNLELINKLLKDLPDDFERLKCILVILEGICPDCGNLAGDYCFCQRDE